MLRSVGMFMSIWRDLAYAARSLAKARAFTLVSVVSLGIGMVPVIAIPYFSRITRTPPPGVNPEGMVEIVTTPVGPRDAADRWSYPDFIDLRAAAPGVDLAGWINGQSKTTIQTPAGVETKSVDVMYVSANYFRVVGVSPARGPGFDPAMDDPSKAEPVVILGHDFWQKQLGADPDIVGKTLTLDDIPHVVVGIAPDQFDGHLFLLMRDVYVPLERNPRFREKNAENDVRLNRGNEWIVTTGRLLPGVSLAQANAAITALTSQLAKQFPTTNANKAGIVVPYHPAGSLGRSQFLRLQAVALTLTGTVLVVVCLNVSGMMQVRSAMRERELSIRQAVGASRGRLVRHLLSEAMILATVGGALASVDLFNLPAILRWLVERPFPNQLEAALEIDLSMVAISVGMCVVTSLLFGLLPAARFSRPVIISSLKDDAGVGGYNAGRVRRVTAALQVAIAVPLIVMSAMSLDRFRATATSNLGF